MNDCILCGHMLPELPWWKRIFVMQPPTHDPDGPYAEECWQGLNRRAGITNPGPRPTK